jgi:heterodisulfide reductase subunit A-like polyferredoxin
MKEVEVSKNVLVIGKNEFAKKCGEKLENLGFKSYLIKDSDLVLLKGVVGSFETTIGKNGDFSKINVGAIVVLEDIKKEIFKDEIKIESPDLVITQSKLAKILNIDGKTRKDVLSIAGKTPKSICFFLGKASQSSKVETYNCLKNSLILRRRLGCEVFVLCEDLKIAGSGMEEMYREARREGVVFLKYKNMPEFEVEENIKIKFEDYYLSESEKPVEVFITCDILVVDELSALSGELERIGLILNIGKDRENFLQTENINLYPVLTNRKGVFLVGRCHNPDLLDKEVENEIDVVCEEIYNLLSSGKIAFEEKVKVNPEKCAVCLTCVRSCPHKAVGIGYSDKLSRAHAYIFNQACYCCGICVSLCPAVAIEFEGFDEKNIFEMLEVK